MSAHSENAISFAFEFQTSRLSCARTTHCRSITPTDFVIKCSVRSETVLGISAQVPVHAKAHMFCLSAQSSFRQCLDVVLQRMVVLVMKKRDIMNPMVSAALIFFQRLCSSLFFRAPQTRTPTHTRTHTRTGAPLSPPPETEADRAQAEIARLHREVNDLVAERQSTDEIITNIAAQDWSFVLQRAQVPSCVCVCVLFLVLCLLLCLSCILLSLHMYTTHRTCAPTF